MRNLQKYRGEVSRQDRESRNLHSSAVFWFTGLSGAGKSTIAHGVEKLLFDNGINVYVFDGDNVRHGLCGDLSFSRAARAENIRRIAEVSKLFVDMGTVCLCAFISPMEEDRKRVQQIVGDENFHEIYISCPVSVCESRDVKGFYKLAREGKIKNYTGVSSPYEEPKKPALEVNTDVSSEAKAIKNVFEFVLTKVKV